MCETNGTACTYPSTPERRERRRQRAATKLAIDSVQAQASRVARRPGPSSVSPAQPYNVPGIAGSATSNEAMTNGSGYPGLLTNSPGGSASLPEEGSAHVVNPAIADDDRVFQEYLSNEPPSRNRRMVRSHSIVSPSLTRSRSILFNIVSKRGERELEARGIAHSHLTTLEELIEPCHRRRRGFGSGYGGF